MNGSEHLKIPTLLSWQLALESDTEILLGLWKEKDWDWMLLFSGNTKFKELSQWIQNNSTKNVKQ